MTERANRVLTIVLREMTAYGHAWRRDWNDFDGRQLEDQLNGIKVWAEKTLDGTDEDFDYTKGTEFYNWMMGDR